VLEGIDQPYRVGQTTQEFLLQPYDRLMWEVVMPYIRTTLRYNIHLVCLCSSLFIFLMISSFTTDGQTYLIMSVVISVINLAFVLLNVCCQHLK